MTRPAQATPAELDGALPHIAAAPTDDGPISMLCLRPATGQRIFVDSLSLSCARGIEGDRWLTRPWLRLPDGSPHPDIQVCILSKRVLDLVWRDRKDTVHPGDSFIADMDLSEANLPPGQILQAGSARLRVSDVFNDGCVKWKVRYGAAARDWVNIPANRALRLRGILCRVVADGTIRNGDRLTKVPG